MTRPYVLAEANWRTVRETDYQVAVLPWGAIEAHNYHLPYSADVVQCDYIAAEASRIAWEKGAKVVALPTVPFGVNTGQIRIKLTVNMNPSTQAAILRDVADSLATQGIQKLVILNGHGGNDFKPMIRETQRDFAGMFISALNWYQVLENRRFFDEPGDHAGEMETSNLLHIAPEWVLSLDAAGSGRRRNFKLKALQEGWVWAERDWRRATEDTGVGDPRKATAEKGKHFLEAVTEKIADYFVELADCDVNDLYE